MTSDRLLKPPPENRLSRPKNWLLLKNSASWVALMPGIGMLARTRKTAKAATTNNSRLRSALSEIRSEIFCVKLFMVFIVPVVLVVLVDCSARFFYFSFGRNRDGTTGDDQLFRQFAVAEDFDRPRDALASAHGAALAQSNRVYCIAGGEHALEHRQVYNRWFESDAVERVTAQFGELLQLFADIRADAVAGAGLLTLGAAACCLAAAAAAADAFDALVRCFAL